jgi:putative two-component system response regulator
MDRGRYGPEADLPAELAQSGTEAEGHVERVAGYVRLIAEELGFDTERSTQLSLASTLHDIGKTSVPEAILLKAGPLTPDERREMERHAEHGRTALEGSTSDLVQLAAEIAASHHERWDGTGYPNRLAGEAIPLSGRIVAVADVFDALTSRRVYKNAWPPDEAKAYLAANAGSHFDPACVNAFLARWPEILALYAGELTSAD